ncbi:MAG: P-type conjugative transfer protein TrbG [Pseudomonadota bacterium]
MNIKPIILLAAVGTLAACETMSFGGSAPDIVLDEEPYIEAVLLEDEEDEEADVETAVPTPPPPPIVARTFGPGFTPEEMADIANVSEVRPHVAIETANAEAAIEPHPDNFQNSIQVYPYARGALYQVYTAPDQITDIALQPGEILTSVLSGDTSRWVVGDSISGEGPEAQAHILVMPTTSGLKTNLVITTSRRAYYVELHAFRETYMPAVSWRYPNQPLGQSLISAAHTASRAPAQPGTTRGLQLERLNFRYEITGDETHWRPHQAFDDGRKVYIQFPTRLDQGEAPPLFVVGRDGRTQLVNYRMRDHYYVVDRLFARAELRLGEREQDVVRISRSDLEDD